MKNKTLNILGTIFLSTGLIAACAFVIANVEKTETKATIDPNDYSTANALHANGDASSLLTELRTLTSTGTSGSYGDLWTTYNKVYVKANNTIFDYYSNSTNYTPGTNQCGSYSGEGGCYNREHSIPKSWWNQGDSNPAAGTQGTDPFFVVPTDGFVNSKRSNWALGEVQSSTYTSNNNFSKLGSAKSGSGYSGTVFEPNDSVKGDFARMHFYVIAKYANSYSWTYDKGGSTFTGNASVNFGLTDYAIKLFTSWHNMDKPDDWEKSVNNGLASIQGNRNPFIDHPEYVNTLWGSNANATQYDDDSGGGGDETPAVTNVTVSPSTLNLDLNGTTSGNLTANVTAVYGASTSVTWSSSDDSIAEVTQQGVVTAVGTGTATITATSDFNSNKKDTCTVTVVDTSSGGDPDPVTPGDSETIDMTAQGFSNNQEITSVSGTNCTVTFSQASGTNSPKYFTSGTAVRAYAKNTITVSSTKNIVGITFTFGSDDGSNAISSNCGTFSSPTWTGTANSVTFTIGGSSGNRRIAAIAVTYEGSGGTDPTPVTPTLSSISLDTANVQKEFIVGDTFTYTGLVVTAHYSDESSATVTPTSVSTPDMSSVGAKTVTVSYTEDEITKQDTYSINVSAAPVSNWVISTTAYKTALFGSSYNSDGVSSYTNSWYSTYQNFKVKLENANNNNNAWSYIKMGSNKAASTGTITTDAVIDKPIGKVRITIDAITTNNITSITLYSSSNNSSWSSVGTFDKASGSQEVSIDEPAKNLYYKIEVVCTKSSSNGTITISKVEYFNASISADAWGTNFLSLITCNNGETAPNVTNWGKTKTSYDELLASEQSKVLAAQPNESGSDLQKAIARYVYIVNKYKNRTNYPDYLSKASGSNTMSKYTNDINMNAVLIVICVISTFSGLACFALKYKKKKYE